MHDAIGLPVGSDRLDEECDIIDRISELFPQTSSIRNFRSAGGISTAGYMRFQWKYHQDRVLHVRWDGLFLDIRQKLSSGKSERGVAFPVTWGSDANPIPFDGNGQARLPSQASHDFWCELAGIVAEKI